jgi:hypothetical protein
MTNEVNCCPELLQVTVDNAVTRGFFGGDERDRTVDLLLAKQALYQLSYIPISGANSLPQLEDPVAPFPRDG